MAHTRPTGSRRQRIVLTASKRPSKTSDSMGARVCAPPVQLGAASKNSTVGHSPLRTSYPAGPDTQLLQSLTDLALPILVWSQKKNGLHLNVVGSTLLLGNASPIEYVTEILK